MASKQELQESLIYVNSFGKVSGSDYRFTVRFPQQEFSQISLIGAGIDCWMPNLYDTDGFAFSNFGLAVEGVIRKCDVFISSLAEFVSWYNAQSPNYKLVQQVVPSYTKVFSFKVTDAAGNPVTTALIGDGWRKLGFTSLTAKATHTGSRIFDLSLPPQVVVRLSGPAIKGNIVSTYGQGHFAIPNNAAFGGKLLYQCDQSTPNRNTIYLGQPTVASFLEVELLNCDFARLYTADFGAGRDNNDAEVVLVFAVRK